MLALICNESLFFKLQKITRKKVFIEKIDLNNSIELENALKSNNFIQIKSIHKKQLLSPEFVDKNHIFCSYISVTT